MKNIFGAAILLILLGLYMKLIWLGIDIIKCTGLTTEACKGFSDKSFTPGMANFLPPFSGLVSALVIMKLSITAPGEAPMIQALAEGAPEWNVTLNKIITSVFLLVWLATGFAAFYYGVITVASPELALAPIAEVGKGWCGLAIGAGYAYFGIKR